MSDYITCVSNLITKIHATQCEKIDEIAEKVADVIAADGIIYTFGCGHSHLIGLDSFYRAGGLANVCPILSEPLMLHESAEESSVLEKRSGLARPLFAQYPVSSKDVVFVMSNSGKNPVPVEMAQAAKESGAYVVAILSSSYFNEISRCADGKKLFEVVDAYLDTGAPHGDAVVQTPNGEYVGGVSTVLGSTLLTATLVAAVKKAEERGVQPSLFVSGNVDGGAERNRNNIQKYKTRVKHL